VASAAERISLLQLADEFNGFGVGLAGSDLFAQILNSFFE